MIKITFYHNGFQIEGHSNFAKKGNDIVCASVSGIFFGFINWLEENTFDKNENEKIPLLKIKFKKYEIDTKLYYGFDLLKTQAISIWKSYKKNINLNFVNSDI